MTETDFFRRNASFTEAGAGNERYNVPRRAGLSAEIGLEKLNSEF